MGIKSQLPLDFSESVGICDGAPSNVFWFLFTTDLEGQLVMHKLHAATNTQRKKPIFSIS